MAMGVGCLALGLCSCWLCSWVLEEGSGCSRLLLALALGSEGKGEAWPCEALVNEAMAFVMFGLWGRGFRLGMDYVRE